MFNCANYIKNAHKYSNNMKFSLAFGGFSFVTGFNYCTNTSGNNNNVHSNN